MKYFIPLVMIVVLAGCKSPTPVHQPVENVYKQKLYTFDSDGMYFSDDALKCMTKPTNNQ